MAAPCSSWTGQNALHPLPSKSLSEKRGIANYSLPENLVERNHKQQQHGSRRKSRSSPEDDGIAVLKISRGGKLQARRVVFSQDKRNLLVTTRRFKYGLQGLWNKAASAVKNRGSSNNNNHNNAPDHGEAGEDESTYYGGGGGRGGGAGTPTNAANSGPPVKVISLEAIDRIVRGATSKRFLLAKRDAEQQQSQQHQQGNNSTNNSNSKVLEWLSGGENNDDSSNNNNGDSSGGSDGSSTCCCLTVVYAVPCGTGTPGDGGGGLGQHSTHQHFETLDLVVPDSAEYESLLTSLEDLVALHREERSRYCSALQLLHYHWCVTLGKQLHHPLGLGEFLALCEKLQVPLKRQVLQILFKEDVAVHHRTDDCLPLEDVAALLETIHHSTLPRENLVVDKLWQALRETDPVPPVSTSPSRSRRKGSNVQRSFEHDGTMEGGGDSVELNVDEDADQDEETISAVAFLSFLRSQQKEYTTTLEEATDLVHVLNHQRATPSGLTAAQSSDDDPLGSVLRQDSSMGNSLRLAKADRLTKSHFVAFLTSDANDLLHPTKGKVGADDMSHPLSHYWINSSHDTFLEALPYSSLNPGSGGNGGKSAYQRVKPQLLDCVNEQSYSAALLRGVRCLEIDVWDGLDSANGNNNGGSSSRGEGPVVAKSRPLAPNDKRLPVAAVLQVIRHYLQHHPYAFPILLKIENHCSTAYQQRLAQLLHQYLGKDGRIATPKLQHYDLDAPGVTLPSPESLRGKVVVLGKRPKRIMPGRRVRKDDFDADNDKYVDKTTAIVGDRDTDTADEDDDEEYYGTIVSFGAKGPVRSHSADAVAHSPGELLDQALEESRLAHANAKQAHGRAKDLEQQAKQDEQRATYWAERSGLTPGEVQRRAARAARGGGHSLDDDDDETEEVHLHRDRDDCFDGIDEEEKSAKEEGLEVHEVLPDFVRNNKANYQEAAQEAMDSAGREAQRHALLQEKEASVKMAQANLDMSRKRETAVAESAQRAASEAREKIEHAESAKSRVAQVRELLQNSRDQSSSAGTVVQTALTEAKISEKRAADAEARAKRAAAAADKDRKRAEDETRKEEMLEQEVNNLHDRCLEATRGAKGGRERVEKAAAMLDRVNEQLRLIETSSQFRRESRSADGNNSAFMAKHAAKLEEREMCRELIKEASEEHSAADTSRNRFQQQFEERAYQWKIQADVASQARRSADRSSHVAEELAEHAEEEREAADLRHTARQRAEATVENRDSYRSSFEGQLAEAERAAAEAASLAVQSRKRADHLSKEVERVKDHSRFEQIVDKCEWERKQAQGEYDSAKMEREEKDKIMMEEKRRLDTNSEVYQDAAREAAAETDRIKVEHLYQQEAVTAYNHAVTARERTKQAAEHSKAATYKAESKRLAADRAKEYKNKMDTMVEIPVDLARITLVHTTKHQNWVKSMSLSNVQAHSFAQNVLLRMVDKDPEEERRNMHAFTKNHLVRVYPSWKALQNKSVTNYDPVFAWSLGCQLVACNFHSTDESLLIADGRFRQNGSCGYVLKPAYLIDNISKTENDQRWSFHILSGHHLPKPIRKAAGTASPLVKISIYSGSAKETRISYRTRPSRQAGLNPVWSSNNKFEFVIPAPSVSMICFSVWHAMDDGTENFMAASAFPASCLREGYRSLALFDEHHSRAGAYLSSCLLVKATKR